VVKKGHPLVLHLLVPYMHLLKMLFFWTHLSLFQFLQTDMAIALRCARQEKMVSKFCLRFSWGGSGGKNKMGFFEGGVKGRLSWKRRSWLVSEKTLSVFGNDRRDLEQAG